MSRTAHGSKGSETGCGTGIVTDMTNHDKPPMFDGRMREELYQQRVLVLDGPLDDDNGTVLATQLMTLAAEDPQQRYRAVDPFTRRLGAVDARHP